MDDSKSTELMEAAKPIDSGRSSVLEMVAAEQREDYGREWKLAFAGAVIIAGALYVYLAYGPQIRDMFKGSEHTRYQIPIMNEKPAENYERVKGDYLPE